MKKRLKKGIYRFLQSEGIPAIISLIILWLVYPKSQGQDMTLVDWTLCSSIVIALLLTNGNGSSIGAVLETNMHFTR